MKDLGSKSELLSNLGKDNYNQTNLEKINALHLEQTDALGIQS
jgi:hypothetical protein